jgi:hypothetical protein
MIETPTREGIEGRRIAEGTFYDFKREVDLDKKHPSGGKSAKERFIDDVVAFLNGEGGHLIIGVNESDGVWDSFVPITGDREKTCNKFLQVTSRISFRCLRKSMSCRSMCLADSFSTSGYSRNGGSRFKTRYRVRSMFAVVPETGS